MKKTIWFILFVFIFSLGAGCNVNAVAVTKTTSEQPQITSKSALLVDYQTGTIVFEKNADEQLPIASMTKLASLSIIYDYLDKGIIKENDYVVVSENAAAISNL